MINLTGPAKRSSWYEDEPIKISSYRVDVGDEDFFNFTLPNNFNSTVDTMALCTTFVTVAGFFTNCIAIGVFSARAFDRMSFAVLMKILCMYNIIVLIMGSFRYHSFYLDRTNQVDEDNRRYFCTYLLWCIHVFRHSRTASVMLILYNRIKAVGEPDISQKAVEALRFPILGNSLCLLLSTIYVSRYIDNLDYKTMKYNTTECSFAFLRPYRSETTADTMIINMPFLEHSVIILLLAFLLIKVAIKYSRPYIQNLPKIDSVISGHTLAHLKDEPKGKARVYSEVSKFSTLQKSGMMDVKDILQPVSIINVEERDQEVTAMTVLIVVINTTTSATRDIPESFQALDLYPQISQLSSSFERKSFLDLIFLSYLATMFFFMCASSSQYRHAAFNLLYSASIGRIHSDISLGAGVIGKNYPIKKTHTNSPLLLKSQETSPRNRHRMTSTGSEDRDIELIVANSVWSLDKAYFLNETRQCAIVEKFSP